MSQVPQNRAAERAAISLLSFSPKCFSEMPWTPDLFHDPANQIIFAALESASAAGEPTDLIAVTARMESDGTLEAAGGAAGLSEILLTFGGPNPRQAEYYFGLLSEALVARKTLQAVRAGLPDLEQMTATPAEFVERIAAEAQGPEIAHRATLAEHLDSLCAELERNEPQECFTTGLPSLDRYLAGGFHRGELAVIAADTSRGKSVLLSMAALASAQAGKATLLFSLEMPARDILRRMAANVAGLPILSARDNPTKRHMDAASRAIISLHCQPLLIVDNLSSLTDIEREARRMARLKKADLIVIDYLQLVENSAADNREQAVSEVARKLKNIALGCGSVVLTASQMNEDGKLRESRAIGHHADFVLNIGDGEITVGKNRRGPRGVSVPVTLRGELGRFEEGKE